MTDDKLRNLNLDLEEDLNFEPPKKSKGGVKWGFIIVITLLVGVIGVMTYMLFFNTSDYEQGMIYLKDKQYEAALVEFQKVPPADKDYNFAQSKINYITGLKLFDENKLEEAKPYLKEVALNDEYANEVKFMLEKIDNFEKQKTLEEQLAEDQRKLIEDAQKETEQKIKDTEAAKKYVSEIIRVIDKFESEYQLAKLENSTSIKKNLRALNDFRQQMLDVKYDAENQDQQVLDFRSLADQMMKSRIDIVQEIIKQNVETIENVSDDTKMEITDSDKLKESMVSERDKLKSTYGLK